MKIHVVLFTPVPFLFFLRFVAYYIFLSTALNTVRNNKRIIPWWKSVSSVLQPHALADMYKKQYIYLMYMYFHTSYRPIPTTTTTSHCPGKKKKALASSGSPVSYLLTVSLAVIAKNL